MRPTKNGRNGCNAKQCESRPERCSGRVVFGFLLPIAGRLAGTARTRGAAGIHRAAAGGTAAGRSLSGAVGANTRAGLTG